MRLLIREIKSKTGELHFRRWRILATPWFSIFVHGIYKHDEDQHMHDHPWNFYSLILKGAYSEKFKSKDGSKQEDSVRVALTGAYRKAEDYHKITHLHSKAVYTLVFAGKRRREWGYDVNGKWMENGEYRTRKNAGTLM